MELNIIKQIVEINLPSELLIGLHTNAESFSVFLKEHAAINLFKEGKISSGIASNWLNISRMHFLRLASAQEQPYYKTLVQRPVSLTNNVLVYISDSCVEQI